MHGVTLNIRLSHRSEREARTREQLLRILERYDVTKWLFTRDVVIEQMAIPHSHPALTLNTRHYEDDLLLLATFIHEQLHWFLMARQPDAARAIREIADMFPAIPVEPPEGAGNRDSSHLHILVNWLEYAAMEELLGRDEARALIERKTQDYYRAIYRLVLEEGDRIAEVIDRHGLRP